MKSVACPSAAVLSAYALGTLPREALPSVASHARGCPNCQDRLREADAQADPLISHLRQSPSPDLIDREPELSRMLTKAQNLGTVELVRAHRTLAPALASAGETPTLPPKYGQAAQRSSSLSQVVQELLLPAQGPGELGRLGQFRILKVLGAGGMGIVFQAEDPQLQRPLALKVMLPVLAQNQTARQRFLREARAAAAITHDHVVRIYQVEENLPVPFLAMEFLQGETLDDRLKRQERKPGAAPLPLAEVLRIGREIAEGLSAAHARGLIHRDIKPANIWLEGERGRVKIVDFGLARPVHDDVHLTQQWTIVGTPAYMAPEQANGQAVDERTDLFSLGSVLYLLCTGEMAFHKGNSFETIMAVLLEEPPPVRLANPAIPAEVADLVQQLLAKNPHDRPPSARAVSEALQGLRRQLARPPLPLPEAAPVARPASRMTPKPSFPVTPPGAPGKGSKGARGNRPDLSGPRAGNHGGKPPRSWPLLPGLLLAGFGLIILIGVLIVRPQGMGKLVLEVPNTEVQVAIDGNPIPIQSVRDLIEVAPGKHQLSVTREGFLEYTSDFEVNRGEEVERVVHLERVGPLEPLPLGNEGAWLEAVARMPPIEVIREVGQKLAEINPGFDGQFRRMQEFSTNRQHRVVRLVFFTDKVAQIWPVRALRDLKFLECQGSQPGRGKLADLSQLKGIPVHLLKCQNNRIHDYSPLATLPFLEFLWCDFQPERDTAVLRTLKKLKTLNGLPVAELLDKKAPAGKK